MSDPLITFEDNGFPVELASDRDISKAVRAGRLRPDTVVTIYESSGAITRSRAIEIPRLQSHWTPAEPPAPASVVAVAEDQPPAEAEPASDAPAPEASPGSDDQDEADAADDEARYIPQPEFPPRSSAGPAIVIGGLLLLGLLIVASNLSRRDDGLAPPTDKGIDMNVADLDDAVALPPEEIIGEPRTYFAMREVAVRSASTGAAAELGRLGRGETLYGTLVRVRASGEAWLRLDGGTHSGGYVWHRNLSEDPRPELISSQDETRPVQVDTSVHVRPDSSSTLLQSLPAGTEVSLVGTVRDGWREIALRSGGVGYIGPTALADTTGGDARGVVLRNNCRESIDVRLVYLASFGWSDAAGTYWHVPPGQTLRILYDNRMVEAHSPEIYYHITSRAGTWRSDNSRYLTHGGRDLLMNRANYSIDSNGNYLISFDC